ncbi:MAG: hypothetical protein JNM75_12755 [Rhodospirillales bacterium]|nr:hypothetical protein [Rhodospirillales bacterium]
MHFEICLKNKLQMLSKLGASLILIAACGLPASAAPCLAPPTLVNPIQFIDKCPEDAGGPSAVVAKGRDVYVQLPATRACSKRVSVTKARNVRITGGKFVFADTQTSVISLGYSSGTAFVDGVHIDVNGRHADAIRTYRHTGKLIVQNVRIEGVSGIKSGTHGDIVHAQGGGPLSELILQNVSGYTAYQGLFVPYIVSSGHGTHKLSLDRVNVGYDTKFAISKPLILLFIGDNNHPTNKAPDLGTTLNEVFAKDFSAVFTFNRSVYAKPVKDGVGCATFDPVHKITGKVCGGLPAGGDFAPASLVGPNYNRDNFCSSPSATALR